MKLLSLCAVVLVAAVALNAPPTTMPRPTPPSKAVSASTCPPFRGTLVDDASGSRDEARIAVSPEDLAPLMNRLRTSGGEIGFGSICEDSDRPLTRCRIPVPPQPPAAPASAAGGGNVFINANARKRYEAERKKYEAKRRAWEADANARINAFIAAITPLLATPARASSSDVTAAVERADLMLAEPSEFSNATTAIILITDGVHNATAKETPTLRSNARVAIVNGVGSMGVLAKLTPTPLRFESAAAAIRYFAESGGACAR